jgi:hypothetical protein
MTLGEYFQTNHIEHLVSFRALCRDGEWPQGFIDNAVLAGVERSSIYECIPELNAKLARLYVKEKREELQKRPLCGIKVFDAKGVHECIRPGGHVQLCRSANGANWTFTKGKPVFLTDEEISELRLKKKEEVQP